MTPTNDNPAICLRHLTDWPCKHNDGQCRMGYTQPIPRNVPIPTGDGGTLTFLGPRNDTKQPTRRNHQPEAVSDVMNLAAGCRLGQSRLREAYVGGDHSDLNTDLYRLLGKVADHLESTAPDGPDWDKFRRIGEDHGPFRLVVDGAIPKGSAVVMDGLQNRPEPIKTDRDYDRCSDGEASTDFEDELPDVHYGPVDAEVHDEDGEYVPPVDDGSNPFGLQCADLPRGDAGYFVRPRPGVMAEDWERVTGSPLPGDVVVWRSGDEPVQRGPFGHAEDAGPSGFASVARRAHHAFTKPARVIQTTTPRDPATPRLSGVEEFLRNPGGVVGRVLDQQTAAAMSLPPDAYIQTPTVEEIQAERATNPVHELADHCRTAIRELQEAGMDGKAHDARTVAVAVLRAAADRLDEFVDAEVVEDDPAAYVVLKKYVRGRDGEPWTDHNGWDVDDTVILGDSLDGAKDYVEEKAQGQRTFAYAVGEVHLRGIYPPQAED